MPSSQSKAKAPFFLTTLTTLLAAGAAGTCVIPARPAAVGASAAAPAATISFSPFREVAGGRFVGAAVDPGHLREPAYATVLATNFDSVTPENAMKWASVEPQPGRFTFHAGDMLVAFARQHGMRVRGHTLVWHTQLAGWVAGLSGDRLRAAMLAHVQGVVSHWKGQIAQWDVVNEAFADGDSGGLRTDSPFSALGAGFIADAFRAAHAADPDARLFYNDYEIERPDAPKTEAVYQMVRRLKAEGVPIGGVGFQMHVDPRHWPEAAAIRRNLERFAALGVAVELTEMDVPVGEMAGDLAQRLHHQKSLTHDIVAACVAVRACSGVTFWGFTDRYSWLNDPHWGALRGRLPHRPLPFDAAYRAKPMAAGISAALAGI